jgi:hypothetical protein
MGFTAAMCEMLLQSHVPGFIHLLPAWPTQPSESGFIRNFIARGNIKVSMQWSQEKTVQVVELVFNEFHPWLNGVVENGDKKGFYDAFDSTSSSYGLNVFVGIITKNLLNAFDFENNYNRNNNSNNKSNDNKNNNNNNNNDADDGCDEVRFVRVWRL